MRTALALLIFFASLTGCGFKGPLYMPIRPAAAVKPGVPAPATPAAPDEQRPVPAEAAPSPK